MAEGPRMVFGIEVVNRNGVELGIQLPGDLLRFDLYLQKFTCMPYNGF